MTKRGDWGDHNREGHKGELLKKTNEERSEGGFNTGYQTQIVFDPQGILILDFKNIPYP